MHCGDTQVHLIMNCKQDERRLAPAQKGLSRRVAELLIEKNNELNYFISCIGGCIYSAVSKAGGAQLC